MQYSRKVGMDGATRHSRVEGTRAVMVFLLSTASEAINHGTNPYSQTGE